jgi:hypothetical protein
VVVTRAGKTVSRQTLARRAEGKPGKRKAPSKRKRKPVKTWADTISERQASRVD